MNKELDFVAIDFETATKDMMACQVGLSVVKNGEIVETIVRMIQPPGNNYDGFCTRVHGLTGDDTKEAPTFEKVWEEIRGYLVNTKIIAHNAPFDESVLRKNLLYYEIDEKDILPFHDTMSCHSSRVSLDVLCAGYGIPVDHHHDAGCDAKMCAMVYLKWANGECPDETLMEERASKKKTSLFGRERLSGDILQKDLSKADPNSPFYDKKVVITGEFGISRKELALTLKNMGADIVTGVTKRTNIVVVGVEPGPAKMKKIEKLREEGYDIRTIYEDELKELVGLQ